jgi:regulation of enolase protein 1 (concanavalin A-like superfamily)
MEWLNEPPSWREDSGTLHVTTGDHTDFWRETHYGFIRDDGHFRFRTLEGDFTATILFAGEYRELYDQAGLMLRIDERNWMKAGIEFVGGRQMLSAVVTRDFSDWSTSEAPAGVEWMGLRISRERTSVRVEWTKDRGATYDLMRLAYLPHTGSVRVGPMCCSPQRADFEARFGNLVVTPGIATDLHA